MSCLLCEGKGWFPLIDQWKVRQYYAEQYANGARCLHDLAEPPFLDTLSDAPCPACSSQALWNYITSRVVNEGCPFRTGHVVIGLLTAKGVTATAMISPGDFPTEANA